MRSTSRAAAGAAGLALLTLPLLAPAAAADTQGPRTKAQVERDERSGHLTKAQVEHRERDQGAGGPTDQQIAPSSPQGSTGTDATAWQLALSAALGGAATGAVVLASRGAARHRHAVAH